VIGLLAVPTGLGVGLPYLSKAGVSPMGVAGGATLAGGLMLFLAGVGRLWQRPNRRRWTLPATVTAVICLGLSSWTLGQAVAATNVPPTPACTSASDGLPAGPQNVTFSASDGVRLSAWYLPGRNGAAVILRHGAGSTRCSVRAQAAVLARHGYAVLMTDARGHGASGGRAMDFGWYGDADIAAAVTFLRQQPGVDSSRIAAVGLSMGAEEALGALDKDGGLAAVVAEGATGRTADDKAWLPGAYGWRGSLTAAIEHVTYTVADLLTDAVPPVSLRAAVRSGGSRPVLLIAAGTRPDEAAVARYLQTASPGTVHVWVVPGATHTRALQTQPQQWDQQVTTFLDAALRP
jgi:pimeloyl-ACP methyl ester carboxylesterase